MFKASTYFIKGQIPGVTKEDLIMLYKRELNIQNVTDVSVNDDTLIFSNKTFRFTLNRFSNKFAGFSQGEIKIADEQDEFGVYLQADRSRLFSSAALIGGAIALFSVLSSGFDLFSLIMAGILFILITVIGMVSTNAGFPVYFTGLRNDLERELQEKKQP